VDDTAARIRERAAAEGFDAVGFAPARLPPEAAEGLARYVAEGRQGEMAWMATTRDRRADPRALMPEARTAIVLGSNYAPPHDPRVTDPGRGAIAAYARNRDYHDLLKKRLKRVARWMADEYGCAVKVFVDTAPLMEKPLAELAGLGWQGRHTNLVSRHFGSWLFLSEILTDLELVEDAAGTDHCGSCDRCVQACPTGALSWDGTIGPRACISYLTIEHKGDIAEQYRAAIGNRIYGCDDCLAVCPWNKFATPTLEQAFLPRPELEAPRLAELAELDDAAFRAFFSGSPIKRTGRDRFVRNVLIAIGNSGDATLNATVSRRLDDPSPLVREAARWAKTRLPAA
jgi:epoxyqueuosine reductase